MVCIPATECRKFKESTNLHICPNNDEAGIVCIYVGLYSQCKKHNTNVECSSFSIDYPMRMIFCSFLLGCTILLLLYSC
uniref:Uncharacterized protein n=1 Tax=Ciona savignyi TaxID=51511 RepID=H2ZB49_CIOSA